MISNHIDLSIYSLQCKLNKSMVTVTVANYLLHISLEYLW
jgi:hypothetical protein